MAVKYLIVNPSFPNEIIHARSDEEALVSCMREDKFIVEDAYVMNTETKKKLFLKKKGK